MSPTEALRQFVLPALDQLTEPDEVSSVGVLVDQDGATWASVDFAGEGVFSTMIYAPWADATGHWGLGKFASDLQDHIAESRHAWGTLRPYPAKWDR
jgi:hypothetical protein